jgi:hypothetical protein
MEYEVIINFYPAGHVAAEIGSGWYWRVEDHTGDTIANGEAFESFTDAAKDVASVMHATITKWW